MITFYDWVQAAVRSASPAMAQHAIRLAHGRGASRWLAAQAGISPRTARRWMSASYPRGRADQIVEAAFEIDPRGLSMIAPLIRAAGQITVLTVEVVYKATDRPEGTRVVGTVSAGNGYFATAAHDLERGDIASAAESFSDGVISEYSPGLEDTLLIVAYTTIELG